MILVLWREKELVPIRVHTMGNSLMMKTSIICPRSRAIGDSGIICRDIVDSSCGLPVWCMNDLSKGDKLALFTFSHHGILGAD